MFGEMSEKRILFTLTTKSSSDRSSSALRASVLFLSFPRAGTARARGVR